MSTLENPNLQAVADTAHQLPPADNSLASQVASLADWVGRTQARVGQFFAGAYESSRDGSVSFVRSVRERCMRLKEEKPVALLAGIAGTAFALGVTARILRSRR
jgi:hypothetical protein